jgi:hypothetical protein
VTTMRAGEAVAADGNAAPGTGAASPAGSAAVVVVDAEQVALPYSLPE